jgi:hypothetical protein
MKRFKSITSALLILTVALSIFASQASATECLRRLTSYHAQDPSDTIRIAEGVKVYDVYFDIIRRVILATSIQTSCSNATVWFLTTKNGAFVKQAKIYEGPITAGQYFEYERTLTEWIGESLQTSYPATYDTPRLGSGVVDFIILDLTPDNKVDWNYACEFHQDNYTSYPTLVVTGPCVDGGMIP